MIGYIVKRLIFVVPTIFVILIFSFVLKNLAPGDEVAAQLEVQGGGRDISKSAYLFAYQELSNDLGFDLPQFYFGVRPSYYPDTLNRIMPKSKKLLMTSILRETKNWEEVSALQKLLRKAQLSLSKLPNQKRAYNEILKMHQDKSLVDLKYRVRTLSNMIDASSPANETVADLIDKINNIEYSNSFVYPTFRFYGGNNQFHKWILRILDSSKNVSLVDGKPAFEKIMKAMKWTVSLSFISLFLVSFFALLLGYLQTLYLHSIFDSIVSFFLYVLLAIPTFWLASLLVIFFTTPEYGAWTNIFPSIGIKPSFVQQSFFTQFLTNLKQLILPIFCLTLASISYLSIQFKSDLLSALKKPFVLMARAKGLSEEKVLAQHALPNALVPFITIITTSIPVLFTGSVIIEVIFNIPGVGQLLLYSAQQSDWPVVFSIVVIISIATILSYILGDVLLMLLYPKTKKGFDLGSIQSAA